MSIMSDGTTYEQDLRDTLIGFLCWFDTERIFQQTSADPASMAASAYCADEGNELHYDAMVGLFRELDRQISAFIYSVSPDPDPPYPFEAVDTMMCRSRLNAMEIPALVEDFLAPPPDDPER